MPPLSSPSFSIMSEVLVDGIVIAVVSFAINVSLAKAFAKKNNYTIDANQVSTDVSNLEHSFLTGFIPPKL